MDGHDYELCELNDICFEILLLYIKDFNVIIFNLLLTIL